MEEEDKLAKGIEGWGEEEDDGGSSSSDGEQLSHMKRNKKKKGSGGFQVMGLSSPIFRGIMKRGYKIPTPIQRKTLPAILEGKDVVAMARTGSGKTACFLIPMFEKLLKTNHNVLSGPRALILSPTRELALQTLKFTKELGFFTRLKAIVVVGGYNMDSQFAAMHDKPDILIATPGRLVHLCVEMSLKLETIQYVVFDEADRLYEMGFAEQINDIIGRLPEVRQTLLFSATLPRLLINFARAGLNNPVLIRLDVEHILSENLKVAFFKCNQEDRLPLLFHLLQNVIGSKEQCVIFVATSHHVEYLQSVLDLAGFSITYCYSSLDPAARKINIAKFQTKQVQHFIVTDVAARGIDIPLLDNVINFNFPAKPKLFVHRVGRVARAGRSGVSYSFVCPDDTPYLQELHMFLGKDIRFAPHPPDKTYKDDWNYMYGSIPQFILDNESEEILTLHKTNMELEKRKIGMQNGYAQYVRCRPVPCKESVRLIKERELLSVIGHHPLLVQNTDAAELDAKRLEMLQKLKTLTPKITVFEMSKNKSEFKSKVLSNMQEKRDHDEARIKAFQKTLQEKREAKEEKEASAKESLERVQKLEQSTAEEVEDTFANVRNANKYKNMKARFESQYNFVEKEKEDFRDKQFYIPYTRGELENLDGAGVGSSFHKDTAEAAMDLTFDDEETERQNKSHMRWDRKKKKFVGVQNEKRIKTESGQSISATYKTNRYKRWLKTGRQHKEVDEEEEAEAANTREGRKAGGVKTLNEKSFGKHHPLMEGKIPTFKRGPRIELRSEERFQKNIKRRDETFKKAKLGRKKNQLALRQKLKQHRKMLRLQRQGINYTMDGDL
ncbi:LOW QUALITY PROTEIN: ATP-dependent RNA helicase DDX54-like [Penaeus chinensis]|uniref:LOW QUALITY PROTEIN: ATP-dependent RNA helicase DDX54-like n=1 Tax=Penaeus chinensis TaxID=139456 RepID=UPI001FB7BED4|nr:LOW QUALITY PROTEIN: ATP-dependent RNA helicase DDX54-like [Penaeus chinensis]